MEWFTRGAESNSRIQGNLMELARETGTDVESVVSWLASAYSPDEAFSRLLA
jgi:hypothetical protein